MSGHSKWNNIKRKKEKTDGQKAKIFTKMGREISVAVKEGGSADPASNSKLKDAIGSSSYWTTILTGVLLLVALIIDSFAMQKARKAVK